MERSLITYEGASEYISRRGRHELANLIIEKTEEQMKEEREAKKLKGEKLKRGRLDVYGAAASKIGISKITLYKWMSGEWQASNTVTKKLIEAAKILDPEKTIKIIEKDLEDSKNEFERILNDLRSKKE